MVPYLAGIKIVFPQNLKFAQYVLNCAVKGATNAAILIYPGNIFLHFLSIYLICSDKFAILEFSFPLQKFAYRESFSEVSGRIHRHQTFPKSVIKRMAIIYNLSPLKLSTSSIIFFAPRAAPNNLSGFLHFRFFCFFKTYPRRAISLFSLCEPSLLYLSKDFFFKTPMLRNYSTVSYSSRAIYERCQTSGKTARKKRPWIFVEIFNPTLKICNPY